MNALLHFVLASALAGTLAGAPADPAAPLQRHPGHGAREAHVMSQFFQIRAARIQASLGLSEDRSRALAERWGRRDREVMDRLRSMNAVRQQLNQGLLSPEGEAEKNARLQPLLAQFLSLRKQQEEAKARFEEELLANLTPCQKVRLIILVEELQPRLRGMLRASRGR